MIIAGFGSSLDLMCDETVPPPLADPAAGSRPCVLGSAVIFARAYAAKAGAFKNAEGALRRAANVWSNKPYEEFEKDARQALAQLDEARKGSLTPPEWCFKAAQRKVKSGDYDPDPVK